MGKSKLEYEMFSWHKHLEEGEAYTCFVLAYVKEDGSVIATEHAVETNSFLMGCSKRGTQPENILQSLSVVCLSDHLAALLCEKAFPGRIPWEFTDIDEMIQTKSDLVVPHIFIYRGEGKWEYVKD